jgi:hypothetical protein
MKRMVRKIAKNRYMDIIIDNLKIAVFQKKGVESGF